MMCLAVWFFFESFASAFRTAWTSLISHRRYFKVEKEGERVLVVGASSGIGRAIAHEYAKRGARVCIVGRREDKVLDVSQECMEMMTGNITSGKGKILGMRADFTVAEDMVGVRDILETGK